MIIFTDPHIEEKYLDELDDVFKEIYTKGVKGEEMVMIGDYYERVKLTPKELFFGTQWAWKFAQKFKTTFVIGNHGLAGGESIILYLKFVGINVIPEYLAEVGGKKVYFGHFMTNKSLFEYGSSAITVKEVEKKADYILLGHQHNPQELSPTVFHLGSCRYVNFNEVRDKEKQYATVDDFGKLMFYPIKSATQMKDVYSSDELSDILPNTKVRMVIKSYEQFKKEINGLAQWRDKFIEFKVKLDFEKSKASTQVKREIKKEQSLEKLVYKWISTIKDPDVQQVLKEVFEDDTKKD
ncbi:MAG: metallophosphoesterase [Promethearchaeota archaeon]